MQKVSPSQYLAEYAVPASPAPLSDIEQALDMTSQASAVVGNMPFFVPQEPTPVPAPVPTDLYSAPSHSFAPMASSSILPGVVRSTRYASPEDIQSLGLPMFLVGQDIAALQTLASSPGLLNTLVDASGMYDQQRLMSLVQTLSASNSGTNLQHAPPPIGSWQGAYQPPTSAYGQPSTINSYGQPPLSFQGSSTRPSYRNRSEEGNLHVSGYGPTTTQVDLINMFAPYVKVDEVVTKANFSFVNTSDPANANRAREALSGTLLGGMPVRINPAQRKSGPPSFDGPPVPSSYGSSAMTTQYGGVPSSAGIFAAQPLVLPSYGGIPGSFDVGFGGSQAPAGFGAVPVQPLPPAPPMNGVPQSDFFMSAASVDAARDDRGNPATKNLFVAGYGSGTTELQLREVFGQHANVIGVILKGAFSFVNTSDRAMAVRARDMLGGTMLNGGPMRINFAKETGRLGTSFDLTYNPRSGPNAPRSGPPPQGGPSSNLSYYGRGDGY
jgi:RNA recognition motif-containing protein